METVEEKSARYFFGKIKIEKNIPITNKSKDLLEPHKKRFLKLVSKLEDGDSFVLPFHPCIIYGWETNFYKRTCLTARQETIHTWRYWVHIPKFSIKDRVVILKCENSLVVNGELGTIDAITKDGYWVLVEARDYLKNTSTDKYIKVFVEKNNLLPYEQLQSKNE